jgi:hypothetical protein
MYTRSLLSIFKDADLDGIGGFGLDPLLAGVHFFNAPPLGAGKVLSTFTVNALGNVSAATYVA